MGTLLAKNADVLVTMDGHRRELKNAGLFARDGMIEKVGSTAELPATADLVLDLRGHILLPGLVNCHHHLDQLLTRNLTAGQNTNHYMGRTFGNTYFMLGADRVWPHKMFEAAEPIISNLGGHVVGKEFTGTETDFAPTIARIASTKAKVLLFALKGDGLNFIPQADDLGLLKGTTVAFLGLSETDLGVFGGKGQNMFVAVPFVATSDVPSVKAFVAKTKAESGADTAISNYVMTHYNALIAMKAAIERAGRVDKESMIDALEGLVIKSPTGTVTIGGNHHAAMNMFMAKTKGRDLIIVPALGEIAPEPRCKY